MDWMAKTRFAAMSCEMVEDDVGDDGDADIVAPHHQVLQVFAAPPEVANSIANWSKRRNISIIPEICVSKYIKSRLSVWGIKSPFSNLEGSVNDKVFFCQP